MADYIYLLENRLAEAQRSALGAVRQVARAKGLTVFLVGGAVRDLTSGSPVRDLDVVVQGNALKLKKDIELAGGFITGSMDAGQALFVRFPGGVRMEIGSTLSVTFPKPGKPVAKPATILEDLRRRDFTANAMALSLNDGSYGLLMDPLNGVADIENRELRLVSNYGFIEDPVRMIRAMRFAARLGWELEEKTKARYETGKAEGYIKALDDFHRGYEAEEIVHEEDPLRVMRRLESEGWMQVLAPGWTTAKANVTDLEKVRESQTQLQMQGIHPDAAAINFPLLTAKLGAKEVQALKASFPRQGFVAEIDAIESQAKEFATALNGRGASVPSAAYRTIVSAKPEALLYVVYATKSSALQTKLKSFMAEWPQARQKIPHGLMQEMRITPEIAGYGELVEKLFFELMDGKLTTVEEMKAFLEPYSPPAPPPPVHVRRPRATKKDAKGKGKGKKGAAVADPEEEDDAESGEFRAEEEGIEVPRGAEEDAEAEDAAEDFDAVAELGGVDLGRSEDEEAEEEEEPIAPPKASVATKAVPVSMPKVVVEEKVTAPIAQKTPVVPKAPVAPKVPVAPKAPVAPSSEVSASKRSVSPAVGAAKSKAAPTPPAKSAGKAALKGKSAVVASSAKGAKQKAKVASPPAKAAPAPAKGMKLPAKKGKSLPAKKVSAKAAPVKTVAKASTVKTAGKAAVRKAPVKASAKKKALAKKGR